MKHHSELLTEDQLKNHSGYQQQADKFVGQKIKSIWVGDILGSVEIETEEGNIRVSGFDYNAGRDAGVFISSTNAKGHPAAEQAGIQKGGGCGLDVPPC